MLIAFFSCFFCIHAYLLKGSRLANFPIFSHQPAKSVTKYPCISPLSRFFELLTLMTFQPRSKVTIEAICYQRVVCQPIWRFSASGFPPGERSVARFSPMRKHFPGGEQQGVLAHSSVRSCQVESLLCHSLPTAKPLTTESQGLSQHKGPCGW